MLVLSSLNVRGDNSAHPSDAEFVRSSDPVGGVYIATFDPDTVDIDAVVADVSKSKGVTAEHVYRHGLRGFSFRANEAVARAVCQHPSVSHVYEATKFYAGGSGSQSPVPSWGLDRINALTLSYDNLYSWAYSGAGVVAYVIDSGINPTPDLPAARIRESRNFVSAESRTDDCAGHGTYVAEVLGGANYGVAKDVIFANYRVLNCLNNGSDADIAAAIDAMIATHAAQPNELAVANMSIYSSTNTNPVIDSAVSRAVSAGIIVVTIAGNITGLSPSNDACTTSPGHLGYSVSPNGIITVAATDSADSMWSGSKGGACVDLFAPGADISAGDPRGNSFGTSFAAPHVAGVVAMHLEKSANLEPQYRTPAQIENSVLGTAQRGLLVNLTFRSPNVFIYDGFPRRRPCC